MRLQLPAPWAVCYNAFGDEDMVVEDGWIQNFHYYKEDLLWLQMMRRAANEETVYELDPAGWLVDVGWYPDGDPAGTYALRIFRDGIEEGQGHHPTFCSRNRHEIAAVLAHLLDNIWQFNGAETTMRQQLAKLQALCDQGKLTEFLNGTDQR